MTDIIVKAATDSPPSPATRWWEKPVIRDFARSGGRYNKFVGQFYDNMKEANTAFSDIRSARRGGEPVRASEIKAGNKDKLHYRKRYNRVARQITKYNNLITATSLSRDISPEEKRARIKSLRAKKAAVAERTVSASHAAFR